MERVPALHAGVLPGQRAVPVRPGAAAALPAAVAEDGQRPARPRLEYRRVVRHQHQLAELRRRVHHGLPGADGRAGGAELPVRRRRHRGRDRADPRVHPVQDRQARQLLVDLTRITIRYLLPLSVIGGLILAATGVIDNFSAYHTVTTVSGAHQTITPVAAR